MLTAKDIHYAYPGGGTALSGISVHIRAGELLLVAGTNGSGKSTLLALLAGLFEPDGGNVACSCGDLDRAARLVMQDADLQILGGTVGEDLLLGRSPDAGSRAREVAARFGLAQRWDDPVQTLSWGSRRKLCLAAALLDEPRLLLLDEPFSGLDYPAALEMRAFLRECRRSGMAVAMAVHDLEPVADLADGLLVLREGRQVLTGTPADVLDHVADCGVRPPCSWLASRRLASWEHEAADAGA
ncbi:MAG: energy-coupling factor ABC transporter ATP-binding protein [Desulfovibrionaceae bacterium]